MRVFSSEGFIAASPYDASIYSSVHREQAIFSYVVLFLVEGGMTRWILRRPFITGASSGLGRASVKLFSAKA